MKQRFCASKWTVFGDLVDAFLAFLFAHAFMVESGGDRVVAVAMSGAMMGIASLNTSYGPATVSTSLGGYSGVSVMFDDTLVADK